MKTLFTLLLFVCAVVMQATSLDISTTPITSMDVVHPSVANLKKIFKCRILGVEIYSPLTFPEILPDETEEAAMEKLRQRGFRVIAKEGVVNIIDALERPTGKSPYPFGQKVMVKAGKYRGFELTDLIQKQTGFRGSPFLMAKYPSPKCELAQDTEMTIRDALNMESVGARGTWIAIRDSFSINGYFEGRNFIQSETERGINEGDGCQLYF